MSQQPPELSNSVNNLNVVQDLLKASKTGQKSVGNFLNSLNPQTQIDGNVILASVEAKIIESEGIFRNSYLDAFNKARNKELGVEQKVQKFTPEEKQFLNSKTVNNTQTSQDTGGGFTQIESLVETNLLPLMDKYFFENPLMSKITLRPNGKDRMDVRDVTNDRAGETQSETGALTPVDDTVIVDQLDPRKIRYVDSKNITWLLDDIEDPTTSGQMFGRMERALYDQFQKQIIGATGSDTDGANQGYAILNNKASTGTNRGSLAVTLTGVGITNEIDAINYILGQLPLTDESMLAQQDVLVTYTTFMNIMRTKDANNNYIGWEFLMNGKKPMVVKNMFANGVLVGDLSNVEAKFLRPPRLTTWIKDSSTISLVYDTSGDNTVRFAYKATSTKNGFRHGTLETDGNWAT